MLSAPAEEPLWCIGAMCCSPCAQYKLRTWVLEDDMAAYRCCQGYFDCPPCFEAGRCGDEGNVCCLCIEVVCCPGFAVQASRFHVMDTRNIMPSETDNKLMRFNNALQCLAFICTVFDCDGAEAVRIAADLFFTALVGCMSAQTAHELKAEAAGKAQRPPPGSAAQAGMMGAPRPLSMDRAGFASSAVAPAYGQPQPAYGQPQPAYGMEIGQAGYALQQPQGPAVALAQPVYQSQPAAQPFMVMVPQGLGPGMMMMAQSPYTGATIQVTVPQGIGPGGQFQVMG